jgi:hypothetical protein
VSERNKENISWKSSYYLDGPRERKHTVLEDFAWPSRISPIYFGARAAYDFVTLFLATGRVDHC